jgi:hypothetical protein
VRFTFSGDGSNLISTTEDMANATVKAGKVIEETFGRKLQQVISVVAIEQAVQRTAEWNQQIQETAKKLGTTTTQLQTLNHIASQTGTAEADVQGLFDNIQQGALGALKGNDELLMSFKKIGITLDDLKNKTSSQLFDEVMQKTGDLGDVRNLDKITRMSINNITGTPENIFQSIQQGYQMQPGEGLEGKGQELINNNDILSDTESKEMQIAWSDFTTSLKEAAVKLAPLGTIILAIVKTFVDAIGGIANIISGFNDLIHGKFLDGLKKAGGTLLNAVWGVTGMLFSLFGGLVNLVGTWVGKINARAGKAVKGFADDFTTGWDQFKKDQNEALGISSDVANKGGAIGEAATMVISGGDTAVVKGVGLGARIAKPITRGLGMKGTTAQLGEIASNASKYQGIGNTTILAKEPPVPSGGSYASAKAARESNRKIVETMNLLTLQPNNKMLKRALKSTIPKEYKIAGNILDLTKPGLYMGLAGAGIVGLQAYKNLNQIASSPFTQSKPLTPAYAPMTFQQLAGGAAQLKMGNLFGVGSVGNKIVDLNNRMLHQLEMIRENTHPRKVPHLPQHFYTLPHNTPQGI